MFFSRFIQFLHVLFPGVWTQLLTRNWYRLCKGGYFTDHVFILDYLVSYRLSCLEKRRSNYESVTKGPKLVSKQTFIDSLVGLARLSTQARL